MKAKTFIVGFFAAVAILAAVSFYFSRTIDKSDKTVSAIASPDGKMKAIKVTLAGGGKSPFCFDNISIVLAVYPDSVVDRQKAYEVYAAPCGKFATGAPSPKIEWLSNAALQITTAAHPFAPNAKPIRTKNIDVTRSVHVTFLSLP